MTIRELCSRIELQKDVYEAVEKFSSAFDFESVREDLEGLKDRNSMTEALEHLREALGEDEKKIKILSCMLKCAAEAYGTYQELGIGDDIYAATMKCFTRFIGECKRITGEYAFDREWWTARQVGCMLFRIGQLEYEMEHLDGEPVISIHIPSDADISEEACSASIAAAKRFFARFFKEYADSCYICDSWLMSPVLSDMLPPDSRILAFQKRFEVISVKKPSMDFLEWLFYTHSASLDQLPEDTSLQRKVKAYLQNGGEMSTALGRMKCQETGGHEYVYNS